MDKLQLTGVNWAEFSILEVAIYMLHICGVIESDCLTYTWKLSYSKRMFLALDQVYYWGFNSNTHDSYNYIIKTKWNYFNWKLFTTEEEVQSKLGLGFGIDSILLKREA